jgi:hypothetical protein
MVCGLLLVFPGVIKSVTSIQYSYRNNPSLVWSFDMMIRYRYSQEVYECQKPFDDSNYLEVLRRGEGRKKEVNTSAYEKEPPQLPTAGTKAMDTSIHEEESALANPSTGADESAAHPL